MADKKNKRSIFAKQVSWFDMKLLALRNMAKYRIVSKFSASWIIGTVFVTLTVLVFVSHREWFGNPPIPEDTAQLFFGAGAVTGAMLAIVFAFSSQLMS